jgi:hypothetical protein
MDRRSSCVMDGRREGMLTDDARDRGLCSDSERSLVGGGAPVGLDFRLRDLGKIPEGMGDPKIFW